MSRFFHRTAILWKAALQARPNESIEDWARRYIKLSQAESGDFPGDYDPDLNPLPIFLWEVYRSGLYDEIIIKKSSQSGFTLAVFILICWFVVFVKRNFIYAIDSEEEVEKIVPERLSPLLRTCEPASRLIRFGLRAFTTTLLRFKGFVGYCTGAKSLGKVSNKSAGLVVLDEVTALEKTLSAGVVKKIVGEMRARLKKQTNGFFIELSKVGEWEGMINQDYLDGSQHKCFVPCPHCTATNSGLLSGYQVIEWEQIKFGHCKDLLGGWDIDRVERETYFECIHCKKAVLESQNKPWMIKHRQFRQTNFGEDPDHKPMSRRCSVEITDLYSTFPKLTWGKLAAKFCGYFDARGQVKNIDGLKEFFRDHLARADKAKEIRTEESNILKMTGGYTRGQCPIVPRRILMGVDRQGDHWKWVKAGFNWEGDCWIIDWGTTLNPAPLIEEADKPVIIKRWPAHIPEAERINPVVYRGLVDNRFDQLNVRDFVVSTFLGQAADGTPDYRFHCCYGLAKHTAKNLKDIVSPGPLSKPNAYHKHYPIWNYAISVNNFNTEIHQNRFGRFKQILDARNEGKDPPPGIRRITFPFDLEDDFVREITRETFERDEKTGRWDWKDVRDNDWGDAMRYCFAGWYLISQVEEAPMPVHGLQKN